MTPFLLPPPSPFPRLPHLSFPLFPLSAAGRQDTPALSLTSFSDELKTHTLRPSLSPPRLLSNSPLSPHLVPCSPCLAPSPDAPKSARTKKVSGSLSNQTWPCSRICHVKASASGEDKRGMVFTATEGRGPIQGQ